MTLRRLISGSWLLVAALLAGCGEHQGPTAATGSAPSPTHASSAVPSSTALPTRGTRLTASTVTSVSLRASDVGPLAVGDHDRGIVLAPVSSEQGEPWDTVEVIEVRTAAAKDVAHSAWPDGLINWVATTGDWIGWTDQSAEQGDGATNVLWRIHVRNLATGETKVLASNGDSPNAFVPVLQAEDGYFFWTEPEEDRSARELVWRPGDITAHAILRHTEMTPGSASIAGDKLIYLGPNGRGLDGHTTGGDCWQVSLAGGSPSPITHTALAMACAARGDRIVWTQHIDPDTPTPPADGIYDDPYSIWSVGMDTTSEPVQLHTGYNSTYQLALTDHALVWQKQSGKAVVADLTDPRDQIPLASRAPRRLAAGPGDLAAFATVRGARVTVTVMHIV